MKLIRIYINNLDDRRDKYSFCENAEFEGDCYSLINDFIIAYRRVHYDLVKTKYFKNGNINLYFNEF